jgi:hypothetical protein
MSRQPWKLKRTVQCDKCPWKVTTNPHDIPDNYNVEKHQNLIRTIAGEGAHEQVCAHMNGKPLRIMACHESDDEHCVGWIRHQLGSGNNIRLRIDMLKCENLGELRVVGPQHQTFEDTLPDEK